MCMEVEMPLILVKALLASSFLQAEERLQLILKPVIAFSQKIRIFSFEQTG